MHGEEPVLGRFSFESFVAEPKRLWKSTLEDNQTMMSCYRLPALLLSVGSLFLEPAMAIECAQLPSTAAASKLATAATWANMRKSDGSIAKESKALLESAIQKFQTQPTAPADCGADCPTAPAYIAFDVTPHTFLSDYSERAACSQQLVATKATALAYKNRHFATLDEMTSWFGDFSSGKGKDGGDLYSKCPGDCSPQYRIRATPTDDGIHVDAYALCGPARDKSDNQYHLETRLVWSDAPCQL